MPSRKIKYRRPWMAQYQLESIWAEERYSVIEASTKAGKTAGCLVWLAEQAMAGKSGRNYWWIAPVHRQAMIAYRRMKRGLARGTYTHHDTEQRITVANGAHMWFLSAEKPDNLFGEDVYAAVMDEASRCREAAWHAVRSTLTATEGPVRIIGNVRGRGTWAYRMGQRARNGERGMRYSKITASDAVEAGILSLEEIEDARRNLPDSVFRELYLAEAADIEGRVYRAFGPENITSDAVDGGIEILVGMDFNVCPMTAVLARRVADQLHVWGEIVLRNANTEIMAAELAERYPGRKILVYPDPSGKSRKTSAPVGQTDFTILRATRPGHTKGFEIRAPSSAPPVVDRINEVNALLKSASDDRRLFIHPDCEHLIDALEGLMYKEGTSQPDKTLGLDHICLAGDVHIGTPFGPKAISELARQRHVEVLTMGGRAVRAEAYRTADRANTVTVEFGDGSSVRATEDHPFLTGDGWVKAVDLHGKQCYSEVCDTKLSQRQSRNWMASAFIFAGGISAAMASFCTGVCGRRRMVTYQVGTTSITSTKTRRTTNWITSRASRPKVTSEYISLMTLRALTGSVLQSIRYAISPQSGTAATKGGLGIVSTTNVCPNGFMLPSTGMNARNVEWSFTRIVRNGLDSVLETARLRIDDTLASITRRAAVSIAARSSKSTDMPSRDSALNHAAQRSSMKRVIRVSAGECEPTYNLHVKGVGIFRMANGVITSNCDALGYLVHSEFPLQSGGVTVTKLKGH